ncbi:MAG: uracil-DNA glycosylase [Bacilli bacterium]
MLKKEWFTILKSEFNQPYFRELKQFIKEEYRIKTIYPPYHKIFNALNNTPLDKVKVVILGQDPYHGEGEAHGLSFSVPEGIKQPPSLTNIFKELHNDLNMPIPESGNLTKWAKEGVLLLNSILTVEANKPKSHSNKGWEQFTDKIIEIINKKTTPVIFVFWGKLAQNKKEKITNKKHYIIESAHPSPFSAYSGFFNSKPFSKVNKILIQEGLTPIDWHLK